MASAVSVFPFRFLSTCVVHYDLLSSHHALRESTASRYKRIVLDVPVHIDSNALSKFRLERCRVSADGDLCSPIQVSACYKGESLRRSIVSEGMCEPVWPSGSAVSLPSGSALLAC